MKITPKTDLSECKWRVEGSEEIAEVHPGVAIPLLVRAGGPLLGVPSDDAGSPVIDGGFRLEVEAAYSEPLGHYRLRSFSLIAPEGDEVTGVLLRTVTPLSVMRWILPRTFQFDAFVLSASVLGFVAPELKPNRREEPDGGVTRIDLADVGTVYRLATIVRYPPVKAVAETFGFQTRTASNWIARARAQALT